MNCSTMENLRCPDSTVIETINKAVWSSKAYRVQANVERQLRLLCKIGKKFFLPKHEDTVLNPMT